MCDSLSRTGGADSNSQVVDSFSLAPTTSVSETRGKHSLRHTASNVMSGHNMLIQWFRFPLEPWLKITVNVTTSTVNRLLFQFYCFAPIPIRHHYSGK